MELGYFVEQQVFNYIYSQNYNNIKSDLYKNLYLINEYADNKNWKYAIFFNIQNDLDCLYIGKENSNGKLNELSMRYDFQNQTISFVNIEINDDYNKLDEIDNMKYTNDRSFQTEEVKIPL